MENPETQQKLIEINSSVTPLIEKCKEATINNKDDYTSVTEILKRIVIYKKRIEEIRISLVKPLNDHVKNINADFKKSSEPLMAMERELKSRMLEYRKKEAAEIAKKQEAEKQRQQEEFDKNKKDDIAKMKDEGASRKEIKEVKKEEFDESKVVLPQQEQSVSSGSGTSTAKKIWKFEITNQDEVPRKYLSIDEKKIREDVKAGVREIAGVKIFEDETISIR